jgi:hypothetical protein
MASVATSLVEATGRRIARLSNSVEAWSSSSLMLGTSRAAMCNLRQMAPPLEIGTKSLQRSYYTPMPDPGREDDTLLGEEPESSTNAMSSPLVGRSPSSWRENPVSSPSLWASKVGRNLREA